MTLVQARLAAKKASRGGYPQYVERLQHNYYRVSNFYSENTVASYVDGKQQ